MPEIPAPIIRTSVWTGSMMGAGEVSIDALSKFE
jgi:hypothetical protein